MLVVFQFALAIAFMIGTVVLVAQTAMSAARMSDSGGMAGDRQFDQ